MGYRVIRFLLLFIFFHQNTKAYIVGSDDRSEVHQSTILARLAAKSVGAIVTDDSLIEFKNQKYRLFSASLASRISAVWKTPLCASERFQNQPTLASCSGVLISNGTFLTARHCVFDQSICNKSLIVFNYAEPLPALNVSEGLEIQFPELQIYRCKRILNGSDSYRLGSDWVILELDRETNNYPQVSVAKSVTLGGGSFVIGTPLGLPLKFVPGSLSSVNNSVLEGYFDLAVYASGSPLFDSNGSLVGLFTNQNISDYMINTACVSSLRTIQNQKAKAYFQNMVPILNH